MYERHPTSHRVQKFRNWEAGIIMQRSGSFLPVNMIHAIKQPPHRTCTCTFATCTRHLSRPCTSPLPPDCFSADRLFPDNGFGMNLDDDFMVPQSNNDCEIPHDSLISLCYDRRDSAGSLQFQVRSQLGLDGLRSLLSSGLTTTHRRTQQSPGGGGWGGNVITTHLASTGADAVVLFGSLTLESESEPDLLCFTSRPLAKIRKSACAAFLGRFDQLKSRFGQVGTSSKKQILHCPVLIQDNAHSFPRP